MEKGSVAAWRMRVKKIAPTVREGSGGVKFGTMFWF
jgi:hypothetical protein